MSLVWKRNPDNLYLQLSTPFCFGYIGHTISNRICGKFAYAEFTDLLSVFSLDYRLVTNFVPAYFPRSARPLYVIPLPSS